jgi:hypothetical protein
VKTEVTTAPLTGKVVEEGLVEHPAGAILGETILMCAECGAIGGHTKKCAVARIALAKPVKETK